MAYQRALSGGSVVDVSRKRYLPALVNIGVCCTDAEAAVSGNIADMVASGVKWVRFDAAWYYTETASGVYSWTALDAAVNTAYNAGMNVITVIHTTPQWAQPGTNVVVYGATGSAATGYANFCSVLATRYGHKIAAYELWNEPNLDQFWSPTPSVTAYLTAASLASYAIKQVDPTLTVISAGLGGAGASPDIDVNTWLTAFYAAHGQIWFDGIGIHCYTSDGSLYEVGQLATQMAAASAPQPIWMTETGYPTGTFVDGPGVTEAVQATVVAAIPTSFAAVAPKGGIVVFYAYKDINTGTTAREDNFGVMRRSTGVAKPAKTTLESDCVAAKLSNVIRTR